MITRRWLQKESTSICPVRDFRVETTRYTVVANVWPRFAYVCLAYPFLGAPLCLTLLSLDVYTTGLAPSPRRFSIGSRRYCTHSPANKWLTAHACVPGWSPITSPEIGYCAKSLFLRRLSYTRASRVPSVNLQNLITRPSRQSRWFDQNLRRRIKYRLSHSLTFSLSLFVGTDTVCRYCFDEDDSRGCKFHHGVSGFRGIKIRQIRARASFDRGVSDLVGGWFEDSWRVRARLSRGDRVMRGCSRMVSFDCWYRLSRCEDFRFWTFGIVARGFLAS